MHSREDSPAFNAQIRKTIRQTKVAQPTVLPTARPSKHYAQILRTQLNRQSSTQTQDFDAPYVYPNIPNSSRKRKAPAFYQPPKTRSQARTQTTQQEDLIEGERRTKIVKLKLPLGKTPASRLPGPVASSHQSRAPRVTKDPRRRQRDARGRFLPKNSATTPGLHIPQGETVKPRDIQQLQLKSFLKPKV